jgi:GT2 family glycosyltransferase
MLNHLAIVIPCIRIDALTRRCIQSCSRLYPQVPLMIVVDCGPTDAPESDVPLPPSVTLIISGPVTIAAKRNLAARATSATILAFIDSDAYPREGWLENGQRLLDHDRQLGAVGGPNISPPDQQGWTKAVGEAVRSVLVSGQWNYRKRICPARLVDLLPSCNLLVWREEYVRLGGMDETLFTGEDMDFCRKLTASGKNILYSPDVVVYHQDRTISSLFSQRFTYGASVPKLLQRERHPGYLVYALPAFLIVFLLSWPLTIIWKPWRKIYRLVVGLYLGISILEALRYSHSTAQSWKTLVAILLGNLTPGLGTLAVLLGFSPDLRTIYGHNRK